MTHRDTEVLLHAVATRLRVARHERGLTQAELAERAGLALETISRIEQRREQPTLGTLARLAAALRVGVESLVVSEGEPPRYGAGEKAGAELRRLQELLPELDRRAIRHLLGLARLLAEASDSDSG